MNQLTQEQIKTLEDVFASYPDDFTGIPKLTTMEGIEEQLKNPSVDIGGNVYALYKTPYKYNEELKEWGFSMNKMIIGEQNSK